MFSEPKTGAVSEGGHKNDMLLIGFFVAGLVVIVVAFSYNFMKKRSRATVARSKLYATYRTTDPEQDNEMNPYM